MVNLETYDKEPQKQKNWLIRLWESTIFSDMVRDRKARKAWEKQLQREAEIEARPAIEKAYKEKYKEEMIAKMKGEQPKGKKSAMQKLAEGFGADPNAPKKELDIAGMMGLGTPSGGSTGNQGMGLGGLDTSDDKIKNMIGLGDRGVALDQEIKKKKKKTKKKKKKQTKKETVDQPFDYNKKIADMLK